MSQCRVRLILWLLLVAVSVIGGMAADVILSTKPFPAVVRAVGVIGMAAAHFPLKRTGKLLQLRGETEQWGCTTRLITDDIYRCVRHPHHVAVGVFMTSLGLLIGHRWSFLLIVTTQWLWVIGFLFLVEERELREKFGEAYEAYCERVPMLLPKLRCAVTVLSEPLDGSQSRSPGRTTG
ncbi:MAG: isoprenylcysteine carboxylmethyltransferase family protein [Anaerolineae bacterium]